MNNKPLVSVIIANYNAEEFLRESLNSVLNQSIKNIEIILVDDNSTDKSKNIAFELASSDNRLKVVCLEKNKGPSGARNKGLELAQGEWVSILDSDDLMHHDRLKTLCNIASAKNADIIVDDLLVFSAASAGKSYRYLGDACKSLRWVTMEGFIKSNTFNVRGEPGYGVLKPIIRRSVIEENNLIYDESLKNSEDYDFILKLMLSGASYLIAPYLGYYYRKHAASISYRLDVTMLENMLRADSASKAFISLDNTGASLAASVRHQSIKDMLSFQKVVTAIKEHHYIGAALEIIRNSRSIYFFAIPIKDKANIIIQNIFGYKRPVPETINGNLPDASQRYSHIRNVSAHFK